MRYQKMSARRDSIIINPNSKEELDIVGEYDHKVVQVVAAYNDKTVLMLSDLRLIPSDDFTPHESLPNMIMSDE